MSLISLWDTNKEDIEAKQIQQLVSLAGDGKLKDGSDCCKEIREYFSRITVDLLGEYINQILSNSFVDSGLVLQDAVNEIGRRLDYQVKDGLYQGRKNQIGYDGLWIAPDGFSIVAEVKTTDAYRITLDTVGTYRDKLINENIILNDDSSILIIVGREDTGDLEAQVRGSRHAWDIRIISAESLISLAKIKLNSEEDTGEKMRMLLRPIEYTRLDSLVDIVYTTAQDSEEDTEELIEIPTSTESTVKRENTCDFTDTKVLDKKRESIINSFGELKEKTLIKKTRATYWSVDHALRVGCTLSKPYERGSQRYWYAYHPRWDEFLAGGEEGYLILGCMDLDSAFSIPRTDLTDILDKLNVTVKKDGKHYWHIQIFEKSDGEYELTLPKVSSSLDINKYVFDLK